jgi:hypothetical protein
MPARPGVSARIGQYETLPQLDRPEVSGRGSANVASMSPIDTDPVHQKLAPGATERTITGECFSVGAEYFEYLRSQSGRVSVRTEQLDPAIDVIVQDTDTRSTGKWYPDRQDYLYEFTLKCLQVSPLENPLES